jgi:hypothetical protein
MACEDETLDLVTDALAAAAAGPRRVSVDGREVESHSLKDVIEADRYLRARCATAAGRGARGLRFTKLVPPGAV